MSAIHPVHLSAVKRGRPVKITNEQILEATRGVFEELGAKTTSREIARRAQVSEGTIFKRFSTKVQLFQAALSIETGDVRKPFAALCDRVGKGDVRDNLTRAASDFCDIRRRVEPIYLAALHGVASPEKQRAALSEYRGDCIQFVEQYIEGERRAGRVDVPRPRAWSVVFVSALWEIAIDMPDDPSVPNVVDALAAGLGRAA
ncbi:MAG: TetR/AcrR family transcriptional regulator [Polyangiaceae bacterium]|nr:TetR/AcrR family transcriptional regulator [Polyangiaceae bacterium]